MPFRGKVKLELLRVHKWRLLEPFTYITPDKEKITVPRKFLTDGASLPKIFWSWLGGPLSGKYIRAAIPHDYLCVKKDYPRKRADKIFYWAMRELGVGRIKRRILYRGVRLGAIFRRKK